jgi:hypothetical protein
MMPKLRFRIFPIIVPVVFMALAILVRTLQLTPLAVLPPGYFVSYLGLQAFALFLGVLIERHFNHRLLALVLAFFLSPFFWASLGLGVVGWLQIQEDLTGIVHHVFVYTSFLVFPLLFISIYVYIAVKVEQKHKLE